MRSRDAQWSIPVNTTCCNSALGPGSLGLAGNCKGSWHRPGNDCRGGKGLRGRAIILCACWVVSRDMQKLAEWFRGAAHTQEMIAGGVRGSGVVQSFSCLLLLPDTLELVRHYAIEGCTMVHTGEHNMLQLCSRAWNILKFSVCFMPCLRTK